MLELIWKYSWGWMELGHELLRFLVMNYLNNFEKWKFWTAGGAGDYAGCISSVLFDISSCLDRKLLEPEVILAHHVEDCPRGLISALRCEDGSLRIHERGHTRAAFTKIFYGPTRPLIGYQLFTITEFHTRVKTDNRFNSSKSLFMFDLFSYLP